LTRLVARSGLADLLSAWLPAQRWFAGSGRQVRVEIASDITLADAGATRNGPPGLRHVIADAWLGQERVSYQVPVGIRAELPAELAKARIGALDDGSIAYDGAADPDLAAVLLHGIATGRTQGRLHFAAEPGVLIDDTLPGRPLQALASNTSVVFGDKAILKLLRRPFAGHHPDLEVPAALARNGSKLVAAPLGWIEMPGDGAECAGSPSPHGESVVLGILSVYFPRSTDAWSLATGSLHQPEPDFSVQARQLGDTTARLHAELAEAFGTSVLSPQAIADIIDTMQTELSNAMAVVPELREHELAVRARYAALAAPATQVAVQRIHGDYHLAQVLGTDGAASEGGIGIDPLAHPRKWVVLDFEGEPSAPLAHRRAYAPALRDVAGMLRSFDYAARHEALRHPGGLRDGQIAADWVERCENAFCAGYGDVAGGDPRRSGPLLRALTLQKAVYEAVYEARHRPDWLPIPLAAIAEASR
jgi:maltokinase